MIKYIVKGTLMNTPIEGDMKKFIEFLEGSENIVEVTVDSGDKETEVNVFLLGADLRVVFGTKGKYKMMSIPNDYESSPTVRKGSYTEMIKVAGDLIKAHTLYIEVLKGLSKVTTTRRTASSTTKRKTATKKTG